MIKTNLEKNVVINGIFYFCNRFVYRLLWLPIKYKMAIKLYNYISTNVIKQLDNGLTTIKIYIMAEAFKGYI